MTRPRNEVIVNDSDSGYATLRKVEEHLFDTGDSRAKDFFWRAKTETQVYDKDGWVGHDKSRVEKLALEYDIEIKSSPDNK